MMTPRVAFPVVSAAFLGALVDAVETVTIVLAVTAVRSWRSAGTGALAGLIALALLVLTLGSLPERVPLPPLEFVVGVLLLLFGMRRLRTAVLRALHIIPLHDGQIIFERQSALLGDSDHRHARLHRLTAVASFKAVLLGGLEVVIVLAVSAGHGLLDTESLGVMAACGLIVALGWAARRPLARVPENTLKFAVGTLLSALVCSGRETDSVFPGRAPISRSSALPLSSCWCSSPSSSSYGGQV
jgi:uncharacterized membrane protein